MDAMIRALGEKLLTHGSAHLTDRERRLLHKLASRIENAQHRAPVVPLKDRLAERLSLWAGSWLFISGFLAVLVLWVGFNTAEHMPFDPFPFPLLNLSLSILAPTQALLILMAQNRQVQRSRAHVAKDYAVNLRTAVEVAALREIADDSALDRDVARRLVTDVGRLERKLDRVLRRMVKRSGPTGLTQPKRYRTPSRRPPFDRRHLHIDLSRAETAPKRRVA